MLVGELESLVARHPLRERFWAALMVALYRSGRQADAVRAYQRARDVLVGELGLEPGAELRRLEAAVLAGDSVLDLPDASQRATRADLADSASWPGRGGIVGGVRGAGTRARGTEQVVAGRRGGSNDGWCWSRASRGSARRRCAAAVAREAFETRRGRVVRALRRRPRDPVSAVGRGARPSRRPMPPTTCSRSTSMPAATSWRGSRLSLAARTTAGRTSSSDAESERYLLFGAVVDLLARVSALAPIVLVLDDLHWADRPTVQLLRHVVSADAPLRLLVIGTFRDSDVGPDHPLAEALAALHRESGVERLALRGLGDDELLTLLEATARHAHGRGGCWPCAMRCRPRRTAIRSSSVRCSGTWPRRAPSPRTSRAGGSRARTCGRRACRSASER